MQGCFAPSEVPGVSAQDAATFGAVAEDLIYVDFHARYSGGPWELFRDANNPSSYLAFLAYNNPSFDKQQQLDCFRWLQEERWMRVPDFLVHRSAERSFYDVKPDSISGRSAGVEKVGPLLRSISITIGRMLRGGFMSLVTRRWQLWEVCCV